MDSERATTLIVEAFWLATELQRRLAVADRGGELHKGHPLLRVTGLAWKRYRRRKDNLTQIALG